MDKYPQPVKKKKIQIENSYKERKVKNYGLLSIKQEKASLKLYTYGY